MRLLLLLFTAFNFVSAAMDVDRDILLHSGNSRLLRLYSIYENQLLKVLDEMYQVKYAMWRRKMLNAHTSFNLAAESFTAARDRKERLRMLPRDHNTISQIHYDTSWIEHDESVINMKELEKSMHTAYQVLMRFETEGQIYGYIRTGNYLEERQKFYKQCGRNEISFLKRLLELAKMNGSPLLT